MRTTAAHQAAGATSARSSLRPSFREGRRDREPGPFVSRGNTTRASGSGRSLDKKDQSLNCKMRSMSVAKPVGATFCLSTQPNASAPIHVLRKENGLRVVSCARAVQGGVADLLASHNGVSTYRAKLMSALLTSVWRMAAQCCGATTDGADCTAAAPASTAQGPR